MRSKTGINKTKQNREDLEAVKLTRTSPFTRRRFLRAASAAGAISTGLLAMRLHALQSNNAPAPASISDSGPDSLRAHAIAHNLLFGAAVVPSLLDVEGFAAGKSTDPYTLMFASQANILVAENAMKWGALRPSADKFDFTQADRMMRFAALAGQRVRGHNLCWHESVPAWLKTTANKDNARQILTQHIQTVAGHFRGQLHSWDVVNEAIHPPDGLPDGLRKTLWLDLIGPDYIELAFRTAAAADPQAKLTYNDYNIELDTPEQITKRDAVLALLRRFKAKGVPIQAVGVQSHLQATGPQPGKGLVDFIREAASMNLEVFITEMDVNTHAVPGDADAQDAAVAAVYRDYLRLVLAEANVPIALTWGLDSGHSWLNSPHGDQSKRPDGTPQRPLPFDQNFQPTPSFVALRQALDGAHPAAPHGSAS
jgi:endo-1,4-beta-xylanase